MIAAAEAVEDGVVAATVFVDAAYAGIAIVAAFDFGFVGSVDFADS